MSAVPFTTLTVNATEDTEDVIEVYTIEDLYNINNNMSGNYKLMNDIDMTEATAEGGEWNYMGNGWDPIGSNGAYSETAFTGTFDGNGHRIIGMHIDITTKPSGTENAYIGLFTKNAGTIKNLSLTDGFVSVETSVSSYSTYIGSVCGYNSGIIYNCYNNCPIFGKGFYTYIGGICGYNNTANIELCKNEGEVSTACSRNSYTHIGGICGHANTSKILGCSNTAYVQATQTTTTSTNNNIFIGGICGDINSTTTISECFNTGNISSLDSEVAYCGGISGYSEEDTEIINCYNTGNVIDNANISYIGGICGYAEYYKSSVNAKIYQLSVLSCYSSGGISSDGYGIIGGYSGYYPTISNSYYIYGNSNKGAKQLTEAQMELKTCFVGFDLENTWITDSATKYKYPQLINNRQNTEKEVEHVEVTTHPTKISYYTGEILDVSGGIITVYYIDGTIEDIEITKDMVTQSPFDNAGSQEVVVTYKGISCSYFVNVSVKPIVTSMTLVSPPDKSEFVKNTSFDFTGCRVYVTYDNTTSEHIDVTDDMTTGGDINTLGNQTITYTLNDCSVNFEVSVIPKKAIGLEITSLPDKTTYIEKQNFVADGLEVTAHYNSGESGNINGYSLSGYTSEIGTHTIAVSFSGLTTTFDVEVIEKKPVSIAITKAPLKTQYIQGEKFDNTGMEVTATYDNGDVEVVTSYTVADFSDSVGYQTVAVSFGDVNTTLVVYVEEKLIEKIDITSLPDKTKYIEGEKFSPVGLIVTASYNDNTTAEISDYTITGATTGTVGTKTVTISYGGKTAIFTITVIEKTLQRIHVVLPEKTEYIKGESFDTTGMVVTAYYDNGNGKTVTNYTVAGYTGNVGTNNITVTYGGKTFTFTVIVHDPSGEWIIIDSPTCTETGEKHLYCKECSKLIKTEIISATGHTEVIDKGYSANCTENGLTDGKHCSVCNIVLIKQQTITAKGHTPDVNWTTTKAPTCTAKGTKIKYCSECDIVLETASINTSTHLPVIDEAVEATCTTSGLTQGSHCSACKTILTEQTVIPAKGHTAGNSWIITKTPTCTAKGTQVKYCTDCNAVAETASVNISAHTPDIDEAVEATCLTSGLTEGSHCSACKTVLVIQEIVPPTGHSWNNGYISKSPTCTTAGERIYHCTSCSNTKSETIKALSHDFSDDYIVDVNPTCTTDGSKSKHCSRCAFTTDVVIVNKLGHKAVIDEEVKSNCTETGLTEGSHCSVCNAVLTKQEIIPITEHKPMDEWQITTEASCTEKGIKVNCCSTCNEILNTAEIEKTAHTSVIDSAVNATCTETGLTEGSHCSVCNTVITKQEVVPTIDHNYTEKEIQIENTDKFYLMLTCSACGKTIFRNCNNIEAIVIPDEITHLETNSFDNINSLKEITIGKSVEIIDDYAVGYIATSDEATGEITYSKIDDFVIKGYAGTVAEQYAQANSFEFEVITETNAVFGDVDGDGKITVKDATKIQKIIAGIITV